MKPGDFARALFDTKDLDPVYVALNESSIAEDRLKRWLVAYCAFYHCGLASWLADFDGSYFWDEMRKAAVNDFPCPVGGRWPRGRERRHFRGQRAVEAVDEWRLRYGGKPHEMFDYIAGDDADDSLRGVIERAIRHCSVGSWLAFKIADLVDACLGKRVDQSDIQPFLYDRPRQGFLTIGRMVCDSSNAETDVINGAIEYLRVALRGRPIPHKPGRQADMFCLETVACKYLSHQAGHYDVLNDILEIKHGLAGWVDRSETAREFAAALPVPVCVEEAGSLW